MKVTTVGQIRMRHFIFYPYFYLKLQRRVTFFFQQKSINDVIIFSSSLPCLPHDYFSNIP